MAAAGGWCLSYAKRKITVLPCEEEYGPERYKEVFVACLGLCVTESVHAVTAASEPVGAAGHDSWQQS